MTTQDHGRAHYANVHKERKMKFKEAVKDTNRSVKKVFSSFPSEFLEAILFYKQAWSNVIYANKHLFVFLLCCILMVFYPVLYVYAVAFRMIKK